MLGLLLAREEALLRGEDLTAALDDAAAALTAGTTTTAGAGEVDILTLQGVQQGTPDGHLSLLLPVDGELDIARGDELALSDEQHDDEQQRQQQEDCYADEYDGCIHYLETSLLHLDTREAEEGHTHQRRDDEGDP